MIFRNSQKIFLIILCDLMLNFCSSKKDDKKPGPAPTAETFNSPGGNSSKPTEKQTSDSSPAPAPTPKIVTQATTEVTHSSDASGFAMLRLAPETVSNNIYAVLNYDGMRYDDAFLGKQEDLIINIFGVDLGGIDFRNSQFRSHETKAQTILISKILAMRIAKLKVWDEWFAAINSRNLFTHITDWYADTPGTDNFSDQVETLFWTLFSRPPSSSELTLIGDLWNTTYSAETTDKELRAWITCLYSLLASQEYWHI